MTFAKRLLTAGLVVGGALGALAVYNKMTETLAGELDTVLTGEERRFPWKYGDMFYEVKGSRDAQPLLLVHGFGPGASSFEWRKNIDALAANFRVYAIDLLGFGLSDRPAIDYSAETYADLIHDFLKEVIGKPAVVVAHGMTCAYVIAGAYRRPEYFERLILVTPPTEMLQEYEPNFLNSALKTLLRLPIIGQFTYNLLTTRAAIRGYYDTQGYHNPGLITDELVEYIYTSAHQENSRFPASSLLSGHLIMDIHEPLARLQMPIVAIWGREAKGAPYEVTHAFKRVNPRLQTRLIDKSNNYPQEEQATEFNNLIHEFAATSKTL